MPASTSRLAYEDCYKHFDRALADPVGVRIKATNYASAVNLRSRLNYARKRDREENRDIYQEGDPLYGKSAYDPVLVTVKLVKGNYWVYLVRVDSLIYEVENLSGLDQSDDGNNGTAPRENREEARPKEARRA